jgi:hypothetical protein
MSTKYENAKIRNLPAGRQVRKYEMRNAEMRNLPAGSYCLDTSLSVI